ncbi:MULTISPECIES: hypothetical protein [unclassified Thioalkalivibrio]|uniref:DUF7482 domain-containing protein n=1 Tax=unclassified Thioalkalivibrio TaxID=2621013 RepID=UPI00036F1D85|nr:MULTISPECIES: hypothetical protein [unclassified Thioalkalivibrio]
MPASTLNRRNFLRLGGAGAAGLALGAAFPGLALQGLAGTARAATTSSRAIVGDVIDYSIRPGDWPGAFGHVTMRLHQAVHASGHAWFIRTDASDPEFAEREGLVHVPLLNTAQGRGRANELFLRGDGVPPVIRSVPPADDYSPLMEIKRVRAAGREGESDPASLDSAEAIRSAEEAGAVTVESTGVFVNYPLMAWPEGSLTVDDDKQEYLGGGQLLEPLDTGSGRVTLKLHEAFPGSYYLVTDASLGGPAEMMSVPVSAPLDDLVDVGGTDKVWVFTNGIEGSGVMGHQPAVFGNPAGHPAWSPFWDHFALTWEDPSQAHLLTSAADIRAALEADELVSHDGTPNSPRGFVVNCPVPVTGDNQTG